MYLVPAHGQGSASGHIPDLFLFYSYSLGKSFSITVSTAVEIVVAETFPIYVLEISSKFPITAVASQNHCGFVSHVFVPMPQFTESNIMILLGFCFDEHLVFTLGL